MNGIFNTKSLITFIVTLSTFIACTGISDRPDYIEQIPQIESFVYKPVKTEFTPREAHEVQLLQNPETGEPIFLGAPFWIEKVNNEIWVSDPLAGNITAYNLINYQSTIIAENGRGPSEVERPGPMALTKMKDSNIIVSVLDTGSKSIIQFSENGKVVSRTYSKYFSSEFFLNNILLSKENIFLIQLINHSEFVFGKVDSTGELIGSYIPKLIPTGYQPIMHNRIYFQHDEINDELIYSYFGLPVVFKIDLKSGKTNTIYNLQPSKELDDINIGLDLLALSKDARVSAITKDLFLSGSNLFLIENIDEKGNLILFNLEKEKVEKIIVPVNENGDPIKYNQLILSDGFFFFIDRIRSMVYTLEESEVINSS